MAVGAVAAAVRVLWPVSGWVTALSHLPFPEYIIYIYMQFFIRRVALGLTWGCRREMSVFHLISSFRYYQLVSVSPGT